MLLHKRSLFGPRPTHPHSHTRPPARLPHRRWCSLCGKFQELASFQEERRSCRESLARHSRNRQARKRHLAGALSPAEVGAAAGMYVHDALHAMASMP